MRQKLYLLFVLIFCMLFFTGCKDTDTSILVVGTIHGQHDTNPNYTYQDIVNIIATYKPDAICVEIPDFYFRKQLYLTEMVVASMYGFENNLKVYPIDWWGGGREERAEYEQTDEYKTKMEEADKLVSENTIMQNFIAKYGGDNEYVWNENKQGYEFYNGKDYNDYIREMYNIVISVFGDGPVNLYSEKRNAQMVNLIDNAIKENIGKRIIVFSGSEHKYFFDDAFAKRKDLKLVNIEDILPLQQTTISDNISLFLNKNLAKGYFDESLGDSIIDLMYQNALIEPIHGLGMDFDPSIVPAENIERTVSIIEEWKSKCPNSVFLQFELAWIEFLKGNYEKSIEISKNIENKLNDIPSNNQLFVKSCFWRTLGCCYDMLNEREKAIKCYETGIKVCKEYYDEAEWYIDNIYKDYLKTPYKRNK